MEIVYTADREIIPDSRCPVYPDKISYDAETKTGRFSWKKNIKTVRKGLFDGNGDLLSVVLPPAVSQIAGGAFADSLLNSLSLNAVNPPAIIPTEDEERLNGRFYNENGEEIIPGDEAFTDPDDEDFDFFDDDEEDEEDEEEPGDDGNEDDFIPSNDEDDNPFDEPKELPGISFPVFETETEEDSPLPFLPSSVTALFIPPEAAASYRNAPSRKGYRELLRPFSPAERK